MKEVILNIDAKSSKKYTIQLDDAFAIAFERDIERLLGGKTEFDVKILLNAFVQKCYDYYEQEARLNKQEAHINGIVGNLDKTLKIKK